MAEDRVKYSKFTAYSFLVVVIRRKQNSQKRNSSEIGNLFPCLDKTSHKGSTFLVQPLTLGAAN
jgi:hypothetical protein